MKLARTGAAGHERPAVSTDGDSWFGLDPLVDDVDGLLGRLVEVRAALDAGSLPPLTPERCGPPLARPGKIVCIGLNSRDHAAETGADIPAEPVVFLKAPDTVVGPDDRVLVPRGSVKTDYEVELGVVI